MIGLQKKLFEPSLLQRRAAIHPDVKPLPRLHFKKEEDQEGQSLVIDTHMKKEIVRDGIENGMQVKHAARGRPYGGARYYFTQGPVPGIVVSATARKGNFDQVVLDVLDMELEELIHALLSVSPALRNAVRKESVKNISTNFFPLAIPQECGGPGVGTSIYLKKQAVTDYSTQRPTEAVLYPSTLSYNNTEGDIKCCIGASPLTSDDILLRDCQEGVDDVLLIPESEMTQLLDVFQAKRGRKVAAADAIFAE